MDDATPLRTDAIVAAPEVEDKPFSSVVPAIIGAALLMQTLNATVLSNALPTMARDFHPLSRIRSPSDPPDLSQSSLNVWRNWCGVTPV